MSRGAWLTIVGCLPDGTMGAGAPAGALDAPAVFGPARLLEAVGVPSARRHAWPSPFAAGIEAVLARRGEATTVLASGDPMHFGVGATLSRAVDAHELAVFPAPSAFSLAAARLCWPLEDARCLSLHRSAAEAVLAHAVDGRRLLLLTRDGDQPAEIAAALTRAGFGSSAVAVLEALGSGDSAVHRAAARDLSGRFHALNVMAVACEAGPPVTVDRLEHDGCVTRDEVRLLTVAALAGGRHLWDVGAGSGSVAIAWCRGGGRATLFERDPRRATFARHNVAASEAQAAVIEGDAMDRLGEADEPDRIFVGGAVADDDLMEALLARLAPGGVLVANAVTLDGECALAARYGARGGSLTRIALSHAAPVGRLSAMKPAMTVTQWRIAS